MSRIALRPWEDMAALAVFRDLDPHDFVEAGLVRGANAGGAALWADWRSIEGARCASFVAHAGPAALPFAVLGALGTGQAGVACVALLARDHARWRGPLGRLCVQLRAALPFWCRERGILRLEARSWEAHPTAGRLLAGMGFRPEARLHGFAGGRAVFVQHALVLPAPDFPADFPAEPPIPPQE
ncbi:MAG TPA: hypothetical protein PKD10_05250 [Paracoccaceae bacterium]|nr:hypothetical protein [Paracoccaceae bacterium]HMO70099.1 hypothetical protein [Paracoccaceae bacterium]